MRNSQVSEDHCVLPLSLPCRFPATPDTLGRCGSFSSASASFLLSHRERSLGSSPAAALIPHPSSPQKHLRAFPVPCHRTMGWSDFPPSHPREFPPPAATLTLAARPAGVISSPRLFLVPLKYPVTRPKYDWAYLIFSTWRFYRVKAFIPFGKGEPDEHNESGCRSVADDLPGGVAMASEPTWSDTQELRIGGTCRGGWRWRSGWWLHNLPLRHGQ